MATGQSPPTDPRGQVRPAFLPLAGARMSGPTSDDQCTAPTKLVKLFNSLLVFSVQICEHAEELKRRAQMPDSEWAVVVAALVGVAGSPVTVLVTEWIRNRRPNRLDESRKHLLRQMLNDTRHQWRQLETLSNVIGADGEATMRLLLEIDARGSENNPTLWGLISRNPLPSTE